MLHILMVIDSADEVLSKSVTIDEHRMERLWLSAIPKNRYRLTVLNRKKVTRANILGYYDRLTVARGEGLVFYYAGHGNLVRGTDRHFFDLATEKKPLLRAEVVRAMEAKKAELVVLLTDCCSTPRKLPRLAEERGIGMPAEKLTPIVRCLLFQARGTIDITAATDNASWSDNVSGGLFTRSLERLLLQTPLGSLDSNHDGFVTWNEFFRQLQKETVFRFGEWKEKLLARGDVDEVVKRDLKSARAKQVPYAFTLRETIPSATAQAVVGLENGSTTESLRYRYRWQGREAWIDAVLQPGEKKVHLGPAGRLGGKLPPLEAKLGTSSKVVPFEASGWSGTRAPTASELEKIYRIQKKERTRASEAPQGDDTPPYPRKSDPERR